jgi:hypothetical protein
LTDNSESEEDEEDSTVDPEPDFTEIRFVPEDSNARKLLLFCNLSDLLGHNCVAQL